MIIATFNCNSVRSRLGIILDWLEKHQPDALALQETKVQDADFPLADFTKKGWEVAFRGQKSYNGVAVISREKPEKVSFGLNDGDNGESDPRLAHVRIGGVEIVNTYVPQGRELASEHFAFKLEWFARLKQYFARHLKGAKTVWVGDLNVAPTPADVYDSTAVWPHVCHCQEVIDAYEAVLKTGFVDIFRKHLPEPENFTFWDYRSPRSVERNRGWRIDHVLATEEMARLSVSCEVDIEPRKAEKPSDHTFVKVCFDC
jgi:exodeoxyribonuclease-3